MIVKILGVLDIFVAICFWIFGIFHLSFMSSFILILGFYLLIKGIAFATTLNVVSIIDIVCALIIIGSNSYPMPIVVVIIVSLFILQKGIFSLLS
jgi:hypothetical protein